MKNKLLLLLLLLCPLAHATTWYVRTDGGTATQCTGTTNAPYPGTGTGIACAYNHPYWLLNQSTFAWNTAVNDTIQFVNGSFYMGQTDGTYGLNWPHCAGDGADCHPGPPPDGTKIYGANVGSCHNANHTGLVNPTKLIGISSLYEMWDLHGASNIDMECLDIAPLDTCTSQGVTQLNITSTSLTGNVATFAWSYPGSGQYLALGEPITVTGTTNGGGIFNVQGAIITSITTPSASTGTLTVALTHADVSSAAETGQVYFAGNCNSPGQSGNSLGTGIAFENTAGQQGPINLTLKDIAVHGARVQGIVGGKLNASPTDVFTMSDVYIVGNGDAGWNYDSIAGGCGNTCESQGTMNISYVTSIWNGCIEVQPNGGTFGGNGYNYCVDQGFAGNGDGLVMLSTGGTWNWSHIVTNYNTQDGFDSLHVGDDPVIQPVINLTDLLAEGNEGQSIKGGGGQAVITNSIGIANCDVFKTASNFPANPTGWNALLGLTCRAADAMAFAMQDGDTLTIENVTNIAGDQNTGWDLSTNGCTTNCIVVFKNNTTVGFSSPAYGGQFPQPFAFGTGGNPFTNASSVITNNAWYHVGSAGTTCPGLGSETNYVCKDPAFVAESDVNAMNVNLTASSPLIAAGIVISGLTTDYAGNPRPTPPAKPSIGAYEFVLPPPTAPYFSGVMSGGAVIQ